MFGSLAQPLGRSVVKIFCFEHLQSFAKSYRVSAFTNPVAREHKVRLDDLAQVSIQHRTTE